MSLTHTSDDSLSQILYFLNGEDIYRLLIVGSKRLTARVLQNTLSFENKFVRPTLFPSYCFAFPQLRSIIVRNERIGLNRGHVSLLGRSMLPSEPMAELLSLELDFPLSPLLFAPLPPHQGLNLSSSFPKLTSLIVTSRSINTLPDGWAESLPQTLTSLKLEVCTDKNYNHTPIHSSTFGLLPNGLQELHFGDLTQISAGPLNLARFPDLRVLRLLNTPSWEALDSLPDSLEELTIQTWHPIEVDYIFPLSRIPPKIRVWHLRGLHLEFEYDRVAPSTIEELHLGHVANFTRDRLKQFFHPEKLRKLSWVSESSEGIDAPLLQHLPNIELAEAFEVLIDGSTTLETLPRKLKKLSLAVALSNSPHLPLNHLPPTLKDLQCPIHLAEDVSALPRTLSKLSVFPLHYYAPSQLSTEVWRNLPSQLKRLEANTLVFARNIDFDFLPGTLETLFLNFTGAKDAVMLGQIRFSHATQESLKSLSIHTRNDSPSASSMESTNSFLFAMGAMKRLSRLTLNAQVVINSENLSNLPSSLTDLKLQNARMQNHGLAKGENPNTTDWSVSAFSRLPKGLLSLHLHFWSASNEVIDFRVFSRLPRRLASLTLYTGPQMSKNPKEFYAALPRRLSVLEYSYAEPHIDGLPRDHSQNQLEALANEKRDAIAEYYSDPFWLGLKTLYPL